MIRRTLHRLFLLFEMRLLPGLAQRLVLIAGLIGALSFGGGLVAMALDPALALPEATWWAFLHLTDPGYLGDDDGAGMRALATLLTISGLVVFIGLLVAVITQWLVQRITDFERGMTPVPFEGHVLVLGWTNRSVPILRELLASVERVRGLLDGRRLRVVVLDEEVGAAMRATVDDALAERRHDARVMLRYGSPLKGEHLTRVRLAEAAVVLLPAVSFRDATQVSSDAQVVKTLLAAAEACEGRDPSTLPLIVAELFDATKATIARRAYPGRIEHLASEQILAQMLAQVVRFSGLSYVYRDLLTHDVGHEIYAPPAGALAGVTFDEARRRFGDAVLLGWVHEGRATLLPAPDDAVPAGAHVVLVAESLRACAPDPAPRPSAASAVERRACGEPVPPRRILVLGWGRRVPTLVGALDTFDARERHVTVVSSLSAATRDAQLRAVQRAHTQVEQIEAEFTDGATLEALDPASYDDIVIAGSDWIDDVDEADARSVLAYLMLRALLHEAPKRPDVLVELMTEEAEGLVGAAEDEVIVGPALVSHMLTHVALSPALAPVFRELFRPGSNEIRFANPAAFGVDAGEVQVDRIADGLAALGVVFLGVRGGRYGAANLAPPRTTPLTIERGVELIVVSRRG